MRSLILLCVFMLLVQAQNLEEKLSSLKHFNKQPAQQALSSLANPFALPTTLSDTSLHLEAIINQKALINDQWLSLHQSIQDYRLIRIESQVVTLQKGSSFITLSLLHPLQKTPQ